MEDNDHNHYIPSTEPIASIQAGGYDSLTDHPCGFKFSTRSISQQLAADLENDSYYNSASQEEENCLE
jgi:hypothetical protein